MTTNKKIHIISHTHWDREWYLPFETHHMHLIELMDTLIETLEKGTGYESFHLDGQTIVIDDYLQVRPEMRQKVQKLIKDGKIQIGPWYILQDEFLTSSESNIRNLQYGMKAAKEWGNVTKIGYFPDSFGNIGQAPQLLQQAGIGHAVFGRGVKPTGFNNLVVDSDDFESPFSEMIWQAPDGSQVTGILFANWYCNGNEVPTNPEEAKRYWDERLEQMQKYAATSQLLLMNGCDHQPIQTDLPEAIKVAQELYPDYEFCHSNFQQYTTELQEAIQTDLKVIDGELRSQKTDGWGTLVNTASARVYLKQLNRKAETLLTNVAEPLATFAHMTGGVYDHDLFQYAWKTLMQNHPHDSICGCSVDEVHREMVTRFEKSIQVAESIVAKQLDYVTNQIDTTVFSKYGQATIPFVVYNTLGHEKTEVVEVMLDVKRSYFADGVNQDQLKAFEIGSKMVVDANGAEIPCQVEDMGLRFDYDLPKDKFRQPYMARQVKLTFLASDIPALGYQTFACVDRQGTEQSSTLITENNVMENEFLRVQIEDNGSLTITDKQNQETYHDCGVYEDTGDIGNEYMYKKPNNEEPLTTKDVSATIRVKKDTPFAASFEIIHDWELPVSATDQLNEEQQSLVEFKYRKSNRSEEMVSFQITTVVSLNKEGHQIDFRTHFDNQIKDHRLRVLFPTDLMAATHHVDSIFEVVERDNEPTNEWTNPDNSQHQQKFVELGSEYAGLTVANIGLNEYEILRDGRNTIAITLVRGVRELGDWGYFPTPEAQCLGMQSVSFSVIPHQGGESRFTSYQHAYNAQTPLLGKQTSINAGNIPASKQFISMDCNDDVAFSTLKMDVDSNDIMLRVFNMANEQQALSVQVPQSYQQLYRTNILEKENEEVLTVENQTSEVMVKGNEIITIAYHK